MYIYIYVYICVSEYVQKIDQLRYEGIYIYIANSMTWVCSLQKKSPVFSALIFRNSSKLSSKASSRTFANASFLLPLVTWRRHGKCHGKYDNLGPWITYQNCDCSIANCTNCQKGLVLSNPKRVILTRIYLLVYPKHTSQFSKFRWSHNPFAKYMNRHFNWIILVVFFGWWHDQPTEMGLISFCFW